MWSFFDEEVKEEKERKEKENKEEEREEEEKKKEEKEKEEKMLLVRKHCFWFLLTLSCPWFFLSFSCSSLKESLESSANIFRSQHSRSNILSFHPKWILSLRLTQKMGVMVQKSITE